MSSRLNLAFETGLVALPDSGAILVLRPPPDMDLSALPRDRTCIVQPFRPDHDALAAAGWACRPDLPEGERFAVALVRMPRARALAHGLVAAARAFTDGPIVVDGQKTDGVDSLLKEIRKRAEVEGPLAKAHGKIFVLRGGDFSDWAARPGQVGGFRTEPGMFSADAVDPGSVLLARALPGRIGRHVADLGSGWGYLSARVLQDPDVQTLDLVEADHDALQAARTNIDDPRARFHWADARTWRPAQPLDAVVTNPPFHETRAADPGLGRAFIESAAAMLLPSGTLWLVANRHLPYESTLRACFGSVDEIAGDARFKVLAARRPARRGR